MMVAGRLRAVNAVRPRDRPSQIAERHLAGSATSARSTSMKRGVRVNYESHQGRVADVMVPRAAERIEQCSSLYGLLVAEGQGRVGDCSGGPIPYGGRQATRWIAGPAGANGSFVVGMCQIASASWRAGSTRASLAPR